MNAQPIPLPGCTPEPLMSYLKALGVLRIASEQKDQQARGSWRGGKFGLRTELAESEVIDFLADEYRPSPILSPWNGEGGFLTESGKSFKTIAAIRKSDNPRLQPIREMITAIDGISALQEFGEARKRAKELEKKKKASGLVPDEAEALKVVNKRVKGLKENILYEIRTEFPDASLGWLDACLLVGTEGFVTAPVLGSGGVDGRMEFSANFLGNVLLLLEHRNSRDWLEQALFLRGEMPLLDTSIGQFAPGNIGGPNATQGFEGGSIVNPWDYVLMIEGSVLLAGAVSRRLNVSSGGKATFPFTVAASAAGSGSLADQDSYSARGEIWMPLWHRALSLSEITRMFGEGRAELAGRQSRTAVDFAQAAASLGVDRGIESFTRHGFLQRNGLAFLATPLGRFEVHFQEEVDLLRDIDIWLDRYRRACTDKTPPRFRSALRGINDAIFNYCRYGGTLFFQQILIALGKAERELARGGSFAVDRETRSDRVAPLSNLREAWVEAADDASPEFAIAAALASLSDKPDPGGSQTKHFLGPIRFHMEPVKFRPGGGRLTWTDETPSVVWNWAGLAENLAAVLERRTIEWFRLGVRGSPWRAWRSVPPDAIAAFLYDELDHDKIENLLWGLILCRIPPGTSNYERRAYEGEPLSRAYATLKLFFLCLPEKQREVLLPKPNNKGVSISLGNYEKLERLRPDPRISRLILAGHIEKALGIAEHRLRTKLLHPAPIDWKLESFDLNPHRLAAALLIPVSDVSAVRFWKWISRSESQHNNQPENIANP